MESLETVLTRRHGTEYIIGGQDAAEFAGLVRALHEQFTAAGLVPGDRLALLAAKSELTVAALFAGLRVGLVVVPIDASSPPNRVGRILEDCAPALVLVDSGSAERHDAAIGPERRRAAFESPDGTDDRPTDGVEATGLTPLRLATRAEPLPPASLFQTELAADAPAYIIYTSGTTGTPKGVCVGRSALAAFIAAAIDRAEYGAGTRFLSFFPLHFDPVLMELLVPWAVGGQLRLFSGMGMINDLVQALEADRITDFSCTPSVITMLVSRFSSLTAERVPALRSIWFGGERPNPQDIRSFQQRVPGVQLLNGYGPTECTVACSVGMVPADLDPEQPLSIGAPMAGTEFVLVTGESTVIGSDDEPGELLVGGAQVMLGYWGRDTADGMTELDGRRYYRTGDLVHRRGDQYYFNDRIGRMLKIRGFRVHPAEVEQALESDSDVGQAIVLPGRDGSTLTAVVEARVDQATLQARLRERVPSYMVPQRILVVDRLPRTESGKLDMAGVAKLQDA